MKTSDNLSYLKLVWLQSRAHELTGLQSCGVHSFEEWLALSEDNPLLNARKMVARAEQSDDTELDTSWGPYCTSPFRALTETMERYHYARGFQINAIEACQELMKELFCDPRGLEAALEAALETMQDICFVEVMDVNNGVAKQWRGRAKL